MLEGISKTIGSLPLANMSCAAIGLHLGRNWCLAGIYKVGSLGGYLVASNKAAEWNQTGDEYLTLAKKNGMRNVAAAASLIAIGLASGPAQEKPLPKEEKSNSTLNYVLPAVGLLTGFTVGGYKVGYQSLHAIGWDEQATFRNIMSTIFSRSLREVTMKL